MPKGTKVAKCVSKVMKNQNKDKVAAIKICQTSTGQAYKTGKKIKESTDTTATNNFISALCDRDYSKAKNFLQELVDNKIKERISNNLKETSNE